jgi:tetratricopeptide (TPR) repeat protein
MSYVLFVLEQRPASGRADRHGWGVTGHSGDGYLFPAQGWEVCVNNVVGDVIRPLGDAFAVPALLAIWLVLIIVLTRTGSFVWYFIQQRGRRPLVIRVDAGKDVAYGGAGRGALNDRLLAYLAADAQGSYVIAPGSGGPAAPGVTTEALEPSHGWQAALLRMAIAREPSYLVDVSWPGARAAGDGQRYQAAVRISRLPGDRIVASDAISEQSEEDLIQTVGCFCITFLRGQRRILRQTPRWERWGQGIHGYRAYRRGLEYQHRAELTLDTRRQQQGDHAGFDDYMLALRCFDEAARIEPANLLVQLHRAALLELTGDYSGAADIYQKCHTLWPEHIETAYRLGNARKNLPDHVTYHELKERLEGIEEQLALGNLVRSWFRSVRPWRWNPGERRYWRSWLQMRLPGRVTRRATYVHAVAIAKLLAELSSFLSGPGARPDRNGMRAMDELMADVAAEVLRGRAADSWIQLLHPERVRNKTGEPKRGQRQVAGQAAGHDHAWHDGVLADVSRIPTYTGGQYRGDIGWLALYNVACFFSLAIKLSPDHLPDAFSAEPDDWRDDCARAAIRELGMLVRNPQHALEPDWLGADPDLAPLRQSPTGKAWTSFVGLPAPAVVIPQQPSGTRS